MFANFFRRYGCFRTPKLRPNRARDRLYLRWGSKVASQVAYNRSVGRSGAVVLAGCWRQVLVLRLRSDCARGRLQTGARTHVLTPKGCSTYVYYTPTGSKQGSTDVAEHDSVMREKVKRRRRRRRTQASQPNPPMHSGSGCWGRLVIEYIYIHSIENPAKW